MSLRQEKPASLTEFVALVEELQGEASNPLWYRGCGKASYKLLPSLYRHRSAKRADDFAKLEAKLMTRFRQRSLPFHARSLADDWDTLFFMQHYGVPTRLLDWTESPFIAFYFAVMSAPSEAQGESLRYSASAAVWVLDPAVWNRHALGHQSYEGGVLTPGDDPLRGYSPAPSFVDMNNHPVALYGAHNSPRIVAQRGVFTIFGQNSAPMEQVYVDRSFPGDCLIRVVLRPSLLPRMRSAVLNYGITESVVFPDLEGLAREIRREFKFEV